MECGQSYAVPILRSGFILLTWITLSFFAFSCDWSKPDQSNSQTPEPDPFPKVPYTVSKYKVNHDSLKVIPAKSIKVKAGTPKQIPYRGIRTKELVAHRIIELDPSSIKVLTPGKDSIPLPRKIVIPPPTSISFAEQYASGSFTVLHGDTLFAPVITPVRHSEPKKALPLRMSDNALNDIQYMSIEQGLYNSSVSSLFADRKGNLWFGQGGYGACMFDGSYVSLYGDSEGFGRVAREFFEDSKGNLWISDWYGVVKYDGVSFTRFFGDRYHGMNSVSSIAEDKAGAIWFGTERGLISLKGDTLTYYTEKEGIGSYKVRGVLVDSEGNVWAGTARGVVKFDGKSFTQYQGIDGFNHVVFSLIEDREGNIWMGTAMGAYKFDGTNISMFNTSSGLASNWIWCIKEDSKGDIWFSGRGVSKLRGSTLSYYTIQEGLSNNKVRTIIEDKNHDIWLGTTGGGIVRIRDNSFTNFAQLKDVGKGDVNSILEDKSGKVCFIIGLSGLYEFTGDRFESLTHSEGIDAMTWSILEDNVGNKWMATYSGVQRYDGDSIVKYYPDDADTLSRNVAKCIYKDRKGQMWIGYWGGGLMRFDGQFFTSFKGMWQQRPEPGSRVIKEQVSAILEDNEGNLWYGTTQGLFKYDGEYIYRYTDGQSMSFSGINAVINDKNNNMWLGTHKGGVIKFDGHSFLRIFEKGGLGSAQVNSLVEDPEGNIWAGTQNGLYRISASNHYSINFFGSDNGLKEVSFHPNAVCLDSKNRLWWGTGPILTMLDLETYDFSKKQAVVQLKDIQINEEHIYFGASPEKDKGISYSGVAPYYNYPMDLKLSFDHNHLTFNYYSRGSMGKQQLEYQYKMDGLDSHWSKASKETSVNYRNIPPGKYIFNVMALGGGEMHSEAFKYPFTILRPWWASWLAFCVYGLLLLLLVRIYIRFIVKRERMKAVYEIKLVEVEKMKELDALKSRFFASVSHEFRTPLTLLISPINELLQNGGRFGEWDRKLLGIMKRNAGRLNQLIDQLLDISRLESGKMRILASEGDLTAFVRILSRNFLSLAESMRINYQIDLDETDALCVFDRDKTEKILINLLSNAFKYTPLDGSVRLRLEYIYSNGIKKHVSLVRIRVKDTGRGIPEVHLTKIFDRFHQVDSSDMLNDTSMGIGLSLTKELVTLLKGSIEVESVVGEGSVFTVSFPVSREDYANCDWEKPDKLREDLIQGDKIPVQLEPVAEDAQILSSRQRNGNPEVLIVEDNKDLREYISQKLDSQYLITEAKNGKEGMQMALDRIPDLIISDLMMPVMDGVRMCSQLKTDPKTSHIPIIMLTAKADKRSKLEGLETGADDFIIKPFDTEELQSRVRNLIKQREKLREKFRKEFVMKSEEQIPVSPQDHLVQRILEILEQHISDSEFHMDQLSHDLHMSRAQLFRKVQTVTGYTPNDLFRKIRLKKAASLFDLGHHNIAQVMYQVGFNNQSYFAKSFRGLYKVNPSEYLKTTVSHKSTNLSAGANW